MEADWVQAQQIREKVEKGMDPDDAYDEVMRPKTKPVATKKTNTMPKAKVQLASWLEERFLVQAEYGFHHTRKWRFDWFLPHHDIAVEYEGFLTQGSNASHASIGGIMKDVEKYNEATAMGIRVFRAHAENIRTGEFFRLLERVTGV